MGGTHSSGLPPAQPDVAVTLPPLGNHVTRTSVRRWLKQQWTDGFPTGAPLAVLQTGEIIRAPCAGHLRWMVPVGKPVRIGERVALIRRMPQAPVPQVQLGTDVNTRKPIEATVHQLTSGCYILGVQGMGKSSLLEEIVRQLLELDEAVIVFDPHGKLIDDSVARMPPHRLADTYHLDLKDRSYPFALNMFACADPADEEERDRTRNQVMHAFAKLWPETRSGVYFQKLLPHIVILLIEHPHLTLADVPRLLRDSSFRGQYTRTLKNTGSRQFWEYDYDQLPPNQQRTQTQPLLNRIEELLAEPVITRILRQPQSTINIRQLIEQRKNLFVRLPINEDAYAKAAELVGTMLMASVYAATFSFADVPEDERPGFGLIVDEFQNFATDEYARLFAQGRKFKVKQFLAHQYRDQLAETAMEANKAATLTAQTKIIFAVNKADAQALADDFVSLMERRQHVNLDSTPLAAMQKHPHPVVKEFASRYGQALLDGTRDKLTQPRVPPGRNRYATERPLPILPSRDFGGGWVSFFPSDPATVVRLLNELLYETQKTGRIDKERLRKVLTTMQPLLGRGNPQALRAFARQLQDVLQVLLRDPITIGRTSTVGKEVGLALQHLPPRQAYVRVGTTTAVMQTRALPPPVSPDEAQRRLRQLQEQTRRDLCRPVATQPAEDTAAGTDTEALPTEPPPPAPSARPRRSRVLPPEES